MGGDGGTLNNTRAEHTLRRSVQSKPSSSLSHQRSRASVTGCSLTGAPLCPGETVVDRAGQLFLTEALLQYRLRSRSGSGELQHVWKRSRDVATVRWTVSADVEFVCPVTRSVFVSRAST